MVSHELEEYCYVVLYHLSCTLVLTYDCANALWSFTELCAKINHHLQFLVITFILMKLCCSSFNLHQILCSPMLADLHWFLILPVDQFQIPFTLFSYLCNHAVVSAVPVHSFKFGAIFSIHPPLAIMALFG